VDLLLLQRSLLPGGIILQGVLLLQHDCLSPFTQWPLRCCQSPQICTAFAEIFLCLNSTDQLKVEPTGQVTLNEWLQNSKKLNLWKFRATEIWGFTTFLGVPVYHWVSVTDKPTMNFWQYLWCVLNFDTSCVTKPNITRSWSRWRPNWNHSISYKLISKFLI
jgi:hypothetical protein